MEADNESVMSASDFSLISHLINSSSIGANERDLNDALTEFRSGIGRRIGGATVIQEIITEPDELVDIRSIQEDDDEEVEEDDSQALEIATPEAPKPDAAPNHFRDAVRKYATPEIPNRPVYRSQPPPKQSTPVPPKKESPRTDWTRMFADTEFIPEDFADVNVDEENKNPQTRRQKQEVLFQLLKTYPAESKGQWSMRMPLFELKYELLRREQFKEEQDQITFMKEMMKMIFIGIETCNEKFGPFLTLKGWSQNATADMSRYDRCMKALYHRYFRKTHMSPLMELAWLVVGSAIMWHIQCKFLGGAPTQSQAQQHADKFFNNLHDVADIKPPPDDKKFGFKQAQGNPGISISNLLKLFVK